MSVVGGGEDRNWSPCFRLLVVGGSVEGKVIGVRVELTSSPKVQGDLICKTLLIDENAHFNGISRHTEDPLKDGR